MDNDKPLIDQVPKVAWVAAGWWLGSGIEKEKQAYRAAGQKLPLRYRLFNWFLFLWFAVPAAFLIWVFFIDG